MIAHGNRQTGIRKMLLIFLFLPIASCFVTAKIAVIIMFIHYHFTILLPRINWPSITKSILHLICLVGVLHYDIPL